MTTLLKISNGTRGPADTTLLEQIIDEREDKDPNYLIRFQSRLQMNLVLEPSPLEGTPRGTSCAVHEEDSPRAKAIEQTKLAWPEESPTAPAPSSSCCKKKSSCCSIRAFFKKIRECFSGQ